MERHYNEIAEKIMNGKPQLASLTLEARQPTWADAPHMVLEPFAQASMERRYALRADCTVSLGHLSHFGRSVPCPGGQA